MDIRTKALHRAAEMVGGVETLRVMLGATPHAMKIWMRGNQPPPMSVFLTAVDIVSNPPASTEIERQETRQRSRELRFEADIARAKAAATRERARAICDAIVAGRLAAPAVGVRRTSALAFLQTGFEPRDGAAMVDAAVSAAVSATGADMATLQIVEPEGLLLVAQRGFEAPFLDYFSCVYDEDCACGTARTSGQRVIVGDVENDPIFADKETGTVMLSANARAVQSTPLIGPSGRLVGMLSTHYDHRWQPGHRELDVVDHIARRTAFWLDGGVL
ncbi:MAG TPA: GAF domain-containing protein [Burkholderiales bacterium]|nr:GAF domain-containing protein [Burkholderiales bacterium]